VRKVLIGFVALVALTVAAVLIVPGFIDWNAYKHDITNQVKALTGRQLTIDGNIKMTILPAPAITVNQVSFANADGATDASMVSLGSLEVRVALGPLLSGEIQVQKVRVVDSVVLLEILPDGRANWDIDLADQSSGTPSATVDLGADGVPLANGGANIQLDNVELVNATIMYRDAVSGIDERIEQLNASFKAASLQGPFESIGSVVLRGQPISYEVAVDGIFQGRTVPVNVVVQSEKSSAEIQIVGNVFNLSEDPKFSGTVASEGQSLAALIHTLAGMGGLPSALNQNFSLSSEVNATETAVDLSGLEIRLGDTALMGTAHAELVDVTSASVDLSVKHLNVDKLADLSPFVPSNTMPITNASADSNQSTTGINMDAATAAAPKIPTDLAGAVTLVVEAITYRGEKAGPVRLSTELANGEITVSQFSAQLPGATEIALFGFASVQDSELIFDGESEVAIGDTRHLARWLDVDIAQIPNGRLRHIEASANIRASKSDIRVSDIKASFDRSNLAGGITLALRNRPAFGASFALDRIDLDGYLPKPDTASVETSTSTSNSVSAETGSATETDNDPLAALTALTTFDANTHIKVGEMVHKGVSIKDIDLNTSLLNGTLTIKNASVENFAGASAKAAGTIDDLGGNPRFDNMNLVFAAKSVAELTQMLDIQLPVSPTDIGKVSADVTINGTSFLPTVTGTVSGLGASASLDGRLSALPVKPLIDADVTFAHKNTARLLRVLGVDYQPGGKIGGLNFAAHLRGGLQGVDISKLDVKQGDTIARGEANIMLGGSLPVISASLQTNAIVVDPFLPKGTGTSSASNSSSGTSSSSSSASGSAVPSGAPWPTDKLDLGALKELDAHIQLRAAGLKYGDIAVKDAIVIARLSGGVLSTEDVSGRLFDGNLNLKGVLDARNVPAFDYTMSFNNANIGTMLAATTGEQSATGTLTYGGNFSANGTSVAAMVSALNGTGSFNIKGLDVKGGGGGTPLAGVVELVRGIGQLGAGLSGMDVDGLADAGGSFTIKDGVAQTNDFGLRSGFGDGAATGFVDLAGWNMDVSGNVHLKKNILTALLAKSTGAMDTLPFRVTGAPDNPVIDLDTTSLLPGGGGIPIPGLEKLDEKLPGLGSILQGVLGGGSSQPTTQQPPPSNTDSSDDGLPEPQQQQLAPAPEPKKITPQDIINQILQF
jgi:uncharacterized protein involved in outer membrane biogenesis